MTGKDSITPRREYRASAQESEAALTAEVMGSDRVGSATIAYGKSTEQRSGRRGKKGAREGDREEEGGRGSIRRQFATTALAVFALIALHVAVLH